MKHPTRLDQRTRLTAGGKADIAWWLVFVDSWNGIGLFPQTYSESFAQVVVSDASGGWDIHYRPHPVFSAEVATSLGQANIVSKELLPIVASAALWGQA